ncbi:MAG: type II toxin-antitoxin system antitoxin SocA domain-containing protein [Candidatus Ratteibacteria bacterium]|jgi:hypothetical protein
MKRIEQLLIFILDRAHKMGIKNLSSFQLFKIPYIIQVMSIKYAGIKFLSDVNFLRDKNGPISTDIYHAKEALIKKKYIDLQKNKTQDYVFERHSHRLIKKPPKWTFSKGEMIFLDNFLSELLPLSQKKLKEYAYNTEPMKHIIAQEKSGEIKKGIILDFSKVTVDPDVVDLYSDTK